MLDTGAPLAPDIDCRALADEFNAMTGANIRNATLTAAFIAADEGRSIGMQHLQRAARSEYRAMGRMLSRDGR
jgi:ATP-dependent 26S proteasome regulatory subunit